ncbi:hypothetical protein, partial [Pedobacter psychrodurus]|uniref:hypothetical protein n=1 Tax=Pedobacter psychrodurus TaxID=2530456 RepID=UPI0019804098
IVWTHLLLLIFLGILLTNFNKVQALPKNAVNLKWQQNQKNRCRKEQIALPSLKRSGFVFEVCKNFHLAIPTQNKVPLFF